MNLIDTHFHLDHYRDHKTWYDYINQHKQYTLCVTNSPGVFYSCQKLYPETKYLKFALGYNPQMATNEKFDKNLFNYLLGKTNYIGEVGLDFTGKYKNYQNEQLDCFEYICSSVSKKQVLSVHSKNAEKEVLQILQKHKIRKAILHWYSGDLATLKQLLDAGYYFSINSNMMRTSKGQMIIRSIPTNRILIESDGPFTSVSAHKYDPSKLHMVYSQLNEQLKCNQIERVVWDNFKTLLT